MNILITGASGLIGSRLVPLLESAGHQVVRLVRRPPQDERERQWNPTAEQLEPELFEGAEAVIHLAGENIGEGRWTAARKERLRESRVHGTRILAEALSQLDPLPKAFVVASAIGYYGDRGDEVLTEASPPANDFLGQLCQDWEAAADPAREQGIRCVHVRTGVVLSSQGGALAKMLLPFKLGVGGVMGNGRQYWSWISLEDAARMFQFAVENESLSGPVNGTAPHPVTNREFTKTLGQVLKRPTIFPMPAFAARLALGEMADALILASARVLPERAGQEGFQFTHADLAAALRAALSPEGTTGSAQAK
jgi:uncharacterized protein